MNAVKVALKTATDVDFATNPEVDIKLFDCRAARTIFIARITHLKQGLTLLHLAIRRESPEVLRLLLDHPSVDVNLLGKDSETDKVSSHHEVLKNESLTAQVTTIALNVYFIDVYPAHIGCTDDEH